MKFLNRLLVIVITILYANDMFAQENCAAIDVERVKSEIIMDSLSYRSVNIDDDFDYKVFYVEDMCIVHIHQFCNGVMDAAIQRYYKCVNGYWSFVREESSLNYECEQIGKNLFHAHSYKNASNYEARRYESVMIYQDYVLKPIFEYEGVDDSNHIIFKYANGDITYFNNHLGDTICNDYVISDFNVVDDQLKSYRLKHVVLILEGFDEAEYRLITDGFVDEKIVYLFNNGNN